MSEPLRYKDLEPLFEKVRNDVSYDIYIDNEYRATFGENAHILSWDEGGQNEKIDCWRIPYPRDQQPVSTIQD